MTPALRPLDILQGEAGIETPSSVSRWSDSVERAMKRLIVGWIFGSTQK